VTAQEINKAIAEAISAKPVSPVPDYQGDLNAMHEAENSLGVNREYNYGEHLRQLSGNVGPKGGHFIPNGWGCFCLAHLGARQRAEAFLRTLGKWKD